MSGWKVNCEKYKATEKLFTAIWTSLVDVADTDHDGKITRSEIFSKMLTISTFVVNEKCYNS